MVLEAFEAFGIEAEYMILDNQTFRIRNEAEFCLRNLNGGTISNKVTLGKTTLSNELMCHVIELKGTDPQKELWAIEQGFVETIRLLNKSLAEREAVLCGTAAHPFMSPDEARLWPHGQKQIYRKYNEIFNCKGHGWANLQSIHINLPFRNEEEFGRLHAAVRIVLPLIPYLSASSPLIGGSFSALPDQRLLFYENNQRKVPLITGRVIPEPVFTFKEYEQLLENVYRDMAVYDPRKILQHPWLNSRGAIPKFEDGAVEIRLMDIQECPAQDFSIVSFVIEIVRALYQEEFIGFEEQKAFRTDDLKEVYSKANSYEEERIPAFYGAVFGSTANTFRDLMRLLHNRLGSKMDVEYLEGLTYILEKGNLAKRIRKEVEDRMDLTGLLNKLIHCLGQNRRF